MHRWGNTSNEKRQRCWYISSQEGRIVYLTGVTSPIVSQDMYASFYGLPVDLDIFDNKGINYEQPYLYVRGLLVQDLIHVDYNGRIQYEIVDRGAWSEEVANSDDPYLFEQKRESTGLYETHDVWLNSCRYRCLKSGTKLRPKWNSPDWDEISGDPELWMGFEQPNGNEFGASIDARLRCTYTRVWKRLRMTCWMRTLSGPVIRAIRMRISPGRYSTLRARSSSTSRTTTARQSWTSLSSPVRRLFGTIRAKLNQLKIIIQLNNYDNTK